MLDPNAVALLIIDMQNAYTADKETNEGVARYLKRVTGSDYSTDKRFISSILLGQCSEFWCLFHVEPYLGSSVEGQLDNHRINSLTRRAAH